METKERSAQLLERNNVGAASIACAGAWTALHYAAKYSRVSVVETLIELNADPHSTTRYGDTALHVHCAELSSRSFPQESQARRDRGLQLALHE
jgi:TPP-dependent trihydroxycyclohexane-1,2-dione (THcHDO) dehydratase